MLQFNNMICIYIILTYLLNTKESARIVNGNELDQKFKYPFAGILISSNGIMCGVILIDCQYAITAAHCVENRSNLYTVEFHRHDLNMSNKEENGFKTEICEYYIHPKYINVERKVTFYDIAILKLQKYYKNATIISLSDKENYKDRRPLTILGWGSKKWKGPLSNVPIISTVYYIHNKLFYCQDNGIPIICAHNKNQIEGFNSDICQGDSGGGIWEKETGNLIGLSSFGIYCGQQGHPGGYVKIANKDIKKFIKHHLPNLQWNKGIIKNNVSCNNEYSDCSKKRMPIWMFLVISFTVMISFSAILYLIYYIFIKN